MKTNLYSNIARRRKDVGMTQDELARAAGYDNRSSIAKLETGAVDIPFSKILAIAEALQTDPVELMGLDPVDTYSRPVVELNDYEQLMVMRLRAITEEQQQFIEHVAIREYKLATTGKLQSKKMMSSVMDDLEFMLGLDGLNIVNEEADDAL